jgi:opacity protein-like surface antigen
MYKKLLKKALIIAVCGCSANLYAVGPGFYMGFMTGPSTNSAKTVNAIEAPGTQQPLTYTEVTAKSNQWGTGFYLGYKNNQYVGSEFGFNYFTTVGFDSKNNTPTAGGTSARVRAIYLALKGSMPIGTAFDVFGKIGPSFQYASSSGGLNGPVTQCRVQPGPQPPLPGLPCDPVTSFKSKYTSKISPMISIGGSWALNQNWVADVTLTTMPVSGVIKNVTWVAFGISYHFVDLYCGQFLC